MRRAEDIPELAHFAGSRRVHGDPCGEERAVAHRRNDGHLAEHTDAEAEERAVARIDRGKPGGVVLAWRGRAVRDCRVAERRLFAGD